MFETTDNNIKYEWGLDGQAGMRVNLYPVKMQNDHADVVTAKKQLRRDLDVVHIDLCWVTSAESQELDGVIPEVLKDAKDVNPKVIESHG